MTHRARWLFADQLGPHFTTDHDGPVLLVESLAAMGRRPMHRQRAHLLLSALRHRAAELGDRATLIQSHTYTDAIADTRPEVINPTSWAARGLVNDLGCTVLPSRGFVMPEDDFSEWATGRKRLLQEDLYREQRRRTGLLMDGVEPTGGRWNLDADNREPPPRGQRTLGLPDPWWPVEDDIDAEVRRDLDAWSRDGTVRLVGSDGPRRFAVTRDESLAALRWFIDERLRTFGPHEDAVLAADWTMSHSLLSVPLNLGLLHPLECAEAADEAYREGRAPLASAEGFIRQVIGWRDYVWHLYWHRGPDYTSLNALDAREPLPAWFDDLHYDDVDARCLSHSLQEVDEHGWSHHIVRLMILGNWALQRGYDPAALTEWFRSRFVDGFEWVMAANVIGMATYADGGLTTTKPYAAGGAYIKRMSDLCQGCRYRPDRRVGDDACPFTAGYWWFLDRHAERLAGNHRLAQPLRGLQRLSDREALVAQESARGSEAP